MILREVTKYEAIRQTIERQIVEGNLNVGDRLPSRRTLAQRHNVSQAPVRQAIRELTRQGVIRTRTGQRGLFVARSPSQPPRIAPSEKSAAIAVAYARIDGMPQLDHAPLMSQLFLESMAEQAMRTGQTLRRMPFRLPSADRDDSALCESLAEHRQVIFLGTDYVHWAEYLKSVRTAAIYLTGLWVPKGVNAIFHDVDQSQVSVVEHLIELGHRAIGFLGHADAQVYESNKFLPWYRTLMAHNIKPVADWIVPINGFQMDGYLAMRGLLERMDRKRLPTAMVCDTDYKAIGAITAIREAGLRVPEDISVVGLDNRPVARAGDPQLTTAGPRWSEVGQVILQAVEAMTVDPPQAPIHVKLPMELAVRGSSGPPRTENAPSSPA